jgi:hypothetical protein
VGFELAIERTRKKGNDSADTVKEGGEYPESETVKPTECGAAENGLLT